MEARRISGTVMPQAYTGLGTGAYRHLFEMDTNLGTGMPWDPVYDGVEEGDLVDPMQRKMRRGTVAVWREFGIWELHSCMINQLAFGWDTNSSTGHCNLDFFAYDLTRTPIVNSSLSLRVAFPNAGPSVLFHQGIIRIGPANISTPLDNDDIIRPMTWFATVQNQLQVAGGPRTGRTVEEFERGGTPLVLGSFNMPRYQSNAFINAWVDPTPLMMTMKFTGPLIPRTNVRYQLNFYLPSVYVSQAEPVGPLPIRANQPVQWFATAPSAPVAGFPLGVKNGPLMIEVIDHLPFHSLL